MMGLISAIGSGLSAAGGAVADIGMTQMKSAIEESRQQRLMEMQEQMAINADGRKKSAMNEERNRVRGDAQANADKRGLINSDMATAAYQNSNLPDDQKKIGLDAVAAAKESGAYRGDVTPKDMAMASDDYRTLATIDQQAEQNAARASDRGEDVAFRNKEMKLRESQARISAAAEGRLAKGAELDQAIKQMSLDNAKRADSLRKEYATADDNRKLKIEQEIQILTGKDNDSYLPVPLKDEMGAITGYKIFDKRRGTWMDDQAADKNAAKSFPSRKLEAYAQQKGKSVAEVRASLESAGWKIQ